MARVTVYQGGGIQRQGTTEAKLRPVDNGPSGLGEGLQTAGRAAGEFIDRMDRVQGIYDEIDAKKLDLEHIEIVRQHKQKVKSSTLGSAAPTVQEATGLLDSQSKELLARARSPRARLALEQSIALRNANERDAWETHALQETVKDFNATSEAREGKIVDAAAEAEDDETFGLRVGEGRAEIASRAQFNNWSPEVREAAELKFTTRAHTTRAAMISNDSRAEALDYVLSHRAEIDETEVARYINAWSDDAFEEREELRMEAGTPVVAAEAVDAPHAIAPQPVRDEEPGDMLRGFEVSSGFGRRARPTAGASTNHMGLDIKYPQGTPIYAPFSGKVDHAGPKGGYGNAVKLEHGQGLETLYGHMSRLSVKPGQVVKKGDVIGYSGGQKGTAGAGTSTGPHLHYAAYVDGKPVDPQSLGKRTVAPTGSSAGIQLSSVNPEQGVSDAEARNAIREDPTLSPRQKLIRLKIYDRRSNEARQQKSQAEADARDAIWQSIDALGGTDRLTDIKQVNGELLARVPGMRSQILEIIDNNAKGANLRSDSDLWYQLLLEANDEKGKRTFATRDMRSFRGKLPEGQVASLMGMQASVRESLQGAVTKGAQKDLDHGRVVTMVNRYFPEAGFKSGDKKAETRWKGVALEAVLARARQHMAKHGEPPNDDELARITRSEMVGVKVADPADGRMKVVPQFQATRERTPAQVEVPLERVEQIRAAFVRAGIRNPSDAQIARKYMELKGEMGW